MTQINATTLDDQVDYLGDRDPGLFTNVFSPRNAAVDDDDEDDDEVIPDDDDDLYEDDDEEVYPDELDKIDDDDDADIIDADIDNDDDRGSVTSGLKGSSFADRDQGRTTGRMIDHEPGSPNTGI